MRGEILNLKENTANESSTFVTQNDTMLLINLDGEVYAKQGSMAAYQGDVDFEFHGGGMGRFFKKVLTGENLQLMKCSGKGDLFVANNGSAVHVISLEDEKITISSENLLAFESGIAWDVNRIKSGVMGFVAGGLFNTTLTGAGNVAITSWGTPVVLKVDQPTFVDVNCVIAWSTELNVKIKSSMKAGALIGRGSGEAFQMGFTGSGFVIVQPGEGLARLTAATASS